MRINIKFQIIIIFSFINYLYGQTLSGYCTGNITGLIYYNPSTDGYLSNAGFTAYQGNLVSSLQYSIFPATGNSCSTLKKVVIIVEGFDRNNEYSNDAIYDYFYSTANNLQNQGIDIITVNFNDARDYIERHSFALIELIKQINNSKVTEDEITIIGASMGGLVARYALSYMEANNIKHRTKLFIAFDTPNKGANIPLGIQSMLQDYYNNPITIGAIYNEWFALNSPSASQLLRHTLLSGSTPPTLNVNMTKFFNKLRGLNGCFGYPKDCKSYAVTLGSLNGTGQLTNSGTPMLSGAIAFDYLATGVQGGYVTTYPTIPPLPSNALSGIICQNNGLLINSSHSKPPSIPVDIAPGGFSNIFGDVADGILQLGISASVNKTCNKACFIPSISSIDYNTTDLFYNVSSDISLNVHLFNTPFENFYSSNVNTNKQHIDYIDFSTLNWIENLIINTNINNTCGVPNININGGIYNNNYYDKAQNNIQIQNLVLNNNKIFDVFAGNEIEIKNEVEIVAGTEFRAYIKNCTAAKSCSYGGNSLRVLNNPVNNLEFTCESYIAKYDSIAKSKINKSSTITATDIFPNPTTSNLNVNFFVPTAQSISISIEDVTGKQLVQQNLIVEAGYSNNLLNLQNYVNGIYILKIADGNGKIIKVEKVLVNH